MSLTTIGELEEKIFSLYSRIATIPLPDFHKLMKEYVEMLRALNENHQESTHLKEVFLAKVKGLPIQVKYFGEPTTDVYGHVWSVHFPEELQRYADCTMIHFHMPPGDRHPTGQRYVGGQTVSAANSPNCIADQIMYNNPTPTNLVYTLSFGYHCYSFGGLPLDFDKIDPEYADCLAMSITDRVRFPTHSPIHVAGIDLRTKLLSKIVVKLDSHID